MPITNLGSKYGVKQALKNTYNCIEHKDWENSLIATNKLQDEMRRYLLSKGKKFDEFDEIFHEMTYLIKWAGGPFKKINILKVLNKITMGLEGVLYDPKDKLLEIYYEIRNLLMDWHKNNASIIMDCFEEIKKLEKEFKELGGLSYNRYPELLESIAKIEPILIRYSKTERPSSSLTSELSKKTGELFVNFMRVYSPPVKLPIDQKTIHRHLGEGASLEEISKAYGQPLEEIIEMLDGKK